MFPLGLILLGGALLGGCTLVPPLPSSDQHSIAESYGSSSVFELSRIALLLPLSGPHIESAKMIERGFLQAFENDPRVQTGLFLPKIRLYDTSRADTMSSLYQHILEEGHSVIVGPLLKKDVTSIARQDTVVPVLALNHSDRSPRSSHVFQLALNPEEEAEQLADFAYRQGLHRMALIEHNDMRSQRFAQSFEQRWKQRGGAITERFALPKDNDPAHFMKKLLSKRESFDILVFAAPDYLIKVWNPYLRFYEATHLPCYAPSVTYWDLDLEGVIFAEIPVLAKKKWREKEGEHILPLVAMGHDAYHLLFHLELLRQGGSYAGWTGTLSLGPEGVIKRRLVIVRMENALPRILYD
jgi:uncharacterized protein